MYVVVKNDDGALSLLFTFHFLRFTVLIVGRAS